MNDKPKLDNVITPKAFSAERFSKTKLDEFRQHGLVGGEGALGTIKDLALPEPSGAELVQGVLSTEEEQLFLAMYHAQAELEDTGRSYGADYFTKVADAIRNKTEGEFVNGECFSEEASYEICRLQRKVEYLRGVFYWYIGERFQIHDYSIGIRGEGKIVRGKRKW